jgi:uncharacterized protein with gpF-like domain
VGKKAKEEIDVKQKRINDLQHKVGILEKTKEQDQRKFQNQLKEAHGETERLRQTLETLKTIAKQHNLGTQKQFLKITIIRSFIKKS